MGQGLGSLVLETEGTLETVVSYLEQKLKQQ